MVTILLIPDTHRPFHNRRAYNLMLEVADYLNNEGAKKRRLDYIYLLGDYGDYYSVSAFTKHPKLPSLLEKEVLDINNGLDELDILFPKAKKIFIEGNHESRLVKRLKEIPALFGIIDSPSLFKLNERKNWEWIEYNNSQAIKVAGSKLRARHEPLGTSAKACASKGLCSMVYGHIHRIEESHIVGMDGTNHVAFSIGWLGDNKSRRGKEVFGYVKSQHQWQLGFGIVYVDPATRYFYHQKIHIMENYTCMVNGKKFKG